MKKHFLKLVIFFVVIIPVWIIDTEELFSFSEPTRIFLLGTLLIGLAHIGRSRLRKNKINESIKNDATGNYLFHDIPKILGLDENFKSFQMMSDRRSYADRRSGRDRRDLVSIHRLFYTGKEKRTKNRRFQIERRRGWVRMSKSSNVYLDDLNAARF